VRLLSVFEVDYSAVGSPGR